MSHPVPFSSEEAAVAAAMRVTSDPPVLLRVHPCPTCPAWHIDMRRIG